MKRLIATIQCALFLALAASAAAPSDFVPDANPASLTQVAADGTNEPRFSIDFPNNEIVTILGDVAKASGINLVVADRIQGHTSIKLRNVTWRQIYREVLTPLGYTFIESGDFVLVVNRDDLTQPWTPDLLYPKADLPDEPKIAVSFTDAPAATVLNNIAKSVHLSLSIPCTLDFTVTLHLSSVTWRQAFRAVLNTHGYTFSEDEFRDEIVTVRPGPALPNVSPQEIAAPQQRSPEATLSEWFSHSTLFLSSAILIPLALLHIVCAIGVARRRLGHPTLFIPKPLWVLFVLGGGIVPLLAYWLMHHSSLVPADSRIPLSP